jgi:hypothetical protein
MSNVNDIISQINDLTGFNIPSSSVNVTSGSLSPAPYTTAASYVATATAPSGTISTAGIAPGSIITSEQILRIINALNGVSSDTIIISGSLISSGLNEIDGTLALPFIEDGNYLFMSGGIVVGSTAIASASFATSASYATTSSLPLLGIVTASATATTITFTKGDQTTFDVTIAQSGSVESASYALFAQNAGTAVTATSASYVLQAVSSSYALTASFALNVPTQSVSSSYALSASRAISAANADTASFVALAQTASYVLNAVSSSRAVSAETSSLPLLGVVTASALASTITFTRGDQTTFNVTISQTGSVQSASYATFAENAGTSSIATSASYALTASYALNVPTQSVSSSYAESASVAISSSYADTASIANIQYVTNSGNLSLGQIQVLDYSDSVATTYVNGLLTFVFGTPAVPSALSATIGDFVTDRFNQVTDNYTVNTSWNNGGYTLISASIYEGSTLLTGITDSGTSLSYNTTTSGSHTYKLAYTASSPLDSSIYRASTTVAGTLSKSQPAAPTTERSVVVQLGSTSNNIEQGATGSITFTSSSANPSNNWNLTSVASNVQSPYYITGSATGSTSISITATANYASPSGENSPPATATSTTTATYNKIRSLRSGATLTASYSQGQLEDLSAWDITLGGSVGTIQKGTVTATGQTCVINWTGSLYQYIVYNSSLANLTSIATGGNNFISSFTLTTTGSYKIYRTTDLQAGYGGSTVTYVLT